MAKGWCCLICLLFFANSYGKDLSETKLVLATTPWCPYTCIHEDESSNLIGQYVSKLLAKHDIALSVESYPWSRSIKFANQGVVDGLLTATYSEAPTLYFTSQAVGYYQVCFFTTDKNPWRYQPPLNLTGQLLGVIKDYGYNTELDQYIEATRDRAKVAALTGEKSLSRLILMLKRERIDLFVADRLVLQWQAAKENIDLSLLINAGCMKKQPFYLALNGSKTIHQTILKVLDREFSLLQNQQQLNHALSHYGQKK